MAMIKLTEEELVALIRETEDGNKVVNISWRVDGSWIDGDKAAPWILDSLAKLRGVEEVSA